MSEKAELRSFERYGFHKGFYNYDDYMSALDEVRFDDYFQLPNNPEFPYDTARTLLKGSCHLFALALNKIFGYNIYEIKGKTGGGFHAFCQVFRRNRSMGYKQEWYYVDARGMTSCFDEFIDGIHEFVSDEYMIKSLGIDEINAWDSNQYDVEAIAFAEAVIKQYKDFYEL